MRPMRAWHRMSVQEVLDYLGSDATQGLSEKEARLRREAAGPNELSGQSGWSIWSIFLEQMRSPMVLILIAACSIPLLLREIPDTVAILSIILINTVLGVREEYKAEKAIASLRQLSDPRVKITRDSTIGEVGSRDLVTGDIIHLEPGDMVPAESRLIFCMSLRVQESSLTGESEPVEKQAGPLEEAGEIPLGDRVNMAYMGTPVVHGRGTGVVVATGMETELGQVARMIQAQEEEPSPLQRRLRRLARRLAFAAVFLVLIVVLTGLSRGEAPGPLLLTAVSLAVAAMPEGLPAVALAVEQGEPDIMERAPIDPEAGIFTRGMLIKIIWVGVLLGLFSLGLGHRSWILEDPAWRTLIFTTLTFGQMANVLAIRTGKQSLFRAGITSNLSLLGAVFLTCVLQLTVVYAPPLQSLFKTTTLTIGQLTGCLFFSSLLFWAVEFEKFIRRHMGKTAENVF